MPAFKDDAYGGNFPKAKRLAIARSQGKCQFCGLRKAVEGHHWAWPNYPSGEDVQGHDLTALCKPCHELATVIRDWVERKGANFTDLAEELEACNTFIAKREAFSYWIYPEEEEDKKYDSKTYNTSTYTPAYTPKHKNKTYKAPNKRRKASSCLAWLLWLPIGMALVYLLDLN